MVGSFLLSCTLDATGTPVNVAASRKFDNFGHRRRSLVPVRTTRRGIASVHLLVGLAAERGLAAGACLRGSDISPRLLREPGAEIEARQELAVVRNIVRHLGPEPG